MNTITKNLARLRQSLSMYIVGLILIALPHITQAACPAPCYATPGQSLWSMMDKSLAASCIGTAISQADVPYTITAPGIYSLCEDLVNTNNMPVITINADDVLLDLKCHTITVNQANVNRIGVSCIGTNSIVRNGFLRAIGVPPATGDVYLINSTGNQRQFYNLGFEIDTNPSSGSFFAIFTNGSINTYTRECIFSGIDISITGGTRQTVEHCRLSGSSILLINTDDVNIEQCLSILGTNFVTATGTQNINIFNCTLENVGNVTNQEVIVIDTCERICIKNCILNSTGFRGPLPATPINGIHFNNSDNIMVISNQIIFPRGTALYTTGGCNELLILSNSVLTASDDGINLAGSTNAFAHNNIVSRSGGANYTNVPAALIATTNADVAAANYWMNVERL